MSLRYAPVLALLALGVDAVYLDVDVYLLQDPVPFLIQLAHGIGTNTAGPAASIRAYGGGVPLSAAAHAMCMPSGRVDAVVQEHFHASCLNSGLFYARASAASVLWLLRLLTWAQAWPVGVEQNLFDASLQHSSWSEAFAPPRIEVPRRPRECPTMMYRLMNVRDQFLISSGGVPRNQSAPWWEGPITLEKAVTVHFVGLWWKKAASRLFRAWASSTRQGQHAEARLRELLMPWRGKPPARRPICFSGRPDDEVLKRLLQVEYPLPTR